MVRCSCSFSTVISSFLRPKTIFNHWRRCRKVQKNVKFFTCSTLFCSSFRCFIFTTNNPFSRHSVVISRQRLSRCSHFTTAPPTVCYCAPFVHSHRQSHWRNRSAESHTFITWQYPLGLGSKRFSFFVFRFLSALHVNYFLLRFFTTTITKFQLQINSEPRDKFLDDDVKTINTLDAPQSLLLSLSVNKQTQQQRLQQQPVWLRHDTATLVIKPTSSHPAAAAKKYGAVIRSDSYGRYRSSRQLGILDEHRPGDHSEPNQSCTNRGNSHSSAEKF